MPRGSNRRLDAWHLHDRPERDALWLHVLIPAAGNAIVTGSGVKADRMKWVKPGTLHMYANINPPVPTNVQLICLPPAGNMKVAAGRTFNTLCKLQGE